MKRAIVTALIAATGSFLLYVGLMGYARAGNPPEPKRAMAMCAKPGGDCVKYLINAGQGAYCTWAAQMATVGAYARDNEASWEALTSSVKPNLDRPLTAFEVDHIQYWLAFGWDSNRPVTSMMDHAYAACLDMNI